MSERIVQINFKFRASTADYQNLCQSIAEAFCRGSRAALENLAFESP